jgi:hypothetical protein
MKLVLRKYGKGVFLIVSKQHLMAVLLMILLKVTNRASFNPFRDKNIKIEARFFSLMAES